MIAVSFEQENKVLDPPMGFTVDQCEALPVHQGHLQSGLPVVISCWKITKEELEELHKTGRVWLMVLGVAMPPVTLSTEIPFVEQEDPYLED